MKLLEIGELIYDRLKDIATTYPLIAEVSTETPYIIYSVDSIERQYTNKDIYTESCSVSVKCYADSYKETVEMAKQVVNALSLNRVKFKGIDIYSKPIATYSTYEIDAYLQTINFIITN